MKIISIRFFDYLLHNKNGESCRAKMAKVAAPKWRKLQRVLDKS